MKKAKIPEILENTTRKKPYFLHNKYGDYKTKMNSYQDRDLSSSPFNRFVKLLEDRIKNTFKTSFGDIIDTEYLDIQNTKELLQDRSKYDSTSFFNAIENLKPIYEEYIKERDQLNKELRNINFLDKSEENKELIKEINEKFKSFYESIKAKCEAVCNNPSVLASCCVEIAYNYSKNKNDSGFKKNNDYSFPWRIAPEGLLENLKTNEDIEKIDVVELKGLNYKNREFEGLLKVKKGIGKIDNVKIKVDIDDGNYQVYHILGQHFIDVGVVRKEKVKVENSQIIEDRVYLKEIKGYKVKLIKLQGIDPEVIIEKIKEGFILTSKNKDICIYCDEEYIATIRFEDVLNVKKKVDLRDYIGQAFRLDEIVEISETKKSMKIRITVDG